MTVRMYGIPNCDTVKKARLWLADRGIEFEFVDYKKVGADPARLAEWVEVAGLDKLLNRAGTTFRKLPDEVKADLSTQKAIAVMVENPSTIKRPVVEYPGGLLVGFKPEEWEKAFA